MADVRRAMVHLASGGTDGHSPYILSDAIRELTRRGHRANVEWVRFEGHHPLHVGWVVNGRPMEICPCLDSDGNRAFGTFFVKCGTCGVRVDASITAKMPRSVRYADGRTASIESLLTDWTTQWPTATSTWDSWASSLAGGDASMDDWTDEAYLNTHLLVDAAVLVDSLLKHA